MKLKTPLGFLSLFLFSTLLIFSTLHVFSQTRKVAGKVVDETGNGVPNVTVTVKGSKVAVQTDAAGDYSIEAAENATLVFSSIGFTASAKLDGSVQGVVVHATKYTGYFNEFKYCKDGFVSSDLSLSNSNLTYTDGSSVS